MYDLKCFSFIPNLLLLFDLLTFLLLHELLFLENLLLFPLNFLLFSFLLLFLDFLLSLLNLLLDFRIREFGILHVTWCLNKFHCKD